VAGPDDLRVSDEQRERAASEIREHYAAGRLNDDELSERVQAAYSARTEQELRAVLADLPRLPATPAQQKAEIAQRRRDLQRRMLQEAGGGVGAFAVCTGIWVVSGASGTFWPIIVLLVVVIPLLRNGWRLYGPDPDFEQVERDLDARRHKNELRSEKRSEARARAGPRSDGDGGPT
jgi:Domain of unknown function (DUF1707)